MSLALDKESLRNQWHDINRAMSNGATNAQLAWMTDSYNLLKRLIKNQTVRLAKDRLILKLNMG